MPNIWYNQYESKLNIASDKLKSDYDLVPRLTFYVIFNRQRRFRIMVWTVTMNNEQ